MIISLLRAQDFHPKVTQEDLDGMEAMIRRETNNHFHNLHARFSIQSFSGNTLTVDRTVEGIQVGSTVEINHSKFNDRVYLVRGVQGNSITLDLNLIPENGLDAVVTLVQYQDDIYTGVVGLLRYDAKMGEKIGIQSEKVARWSVTYNANGETKGGYPSAQMDFIKPHRRLRW